MNFNAYVVTHSFGCLPLGICCWQNHLCLKFTILVITSLIDRIPIIVDEVSERGKAINPRRKDFFAAVMNSSLTNKSIHEIKK